jgi:hypothetical protein
VHRLKESDDTLLAYEKKLHDALFDDGETVLMSSLKDKFYTDLSGVKDSLYSQGVSKNKFFSRNPNAVRTAYLTGGLVLAALGVFAFIGLGILQVGAILGVPLVIAGCSWLASPRRCHGALHQARAIPPQPGLPRVHGDGGD